MSDCLDEVRDINNVVRTCRLLYEKLNWHLYSFDKVDTLTFDGKYDSPRGPRVSADVLFRNQDRLEGPPELYIAMDGNVDSYSLYHAIRWNHVRTAEVLIENGLAVMTRDPSTGEELSLPDGTEYCRGNDVDIERPFVDYLTPLQTAVQYGRVSIVPLLIDRGAKFQDAPYDDFYQEGTPLHMASWLGDVEMVKLLLKHGANTETRADHETPLFWAVTVEDRFPNLVPRNHDAKWKIVQLLLAYGANPQARDRHGCLFNAMAHTRRHYQHYDWSSNESQVHYSVSMGRQVGGGCDRVRDVLRHIQALRYPNAGGQHSDVVDRNW